VKGGEGRLERGKVREPEAINSGGAEERGGKKWGPGGEKKVPLNRSVLWQWGKGVQKKGGEAESKRSFPEHGVAKT